MSNDSILSDKIKSQITRFGNSLTPGFRKSLRRCFVQALYGIQAAEDVKLSNIARALGEDIPMIKTEIRLSRNLRAKDFTEPVNAALLRDGARHVTRDTVIAVDLSDVQKPYAKKMEYLAHVRDGSEDDIGPGYHLLNAVAADVDGNDVTPLWGELYSVEAPGYDSENFRILHVVRMIRAACGENGIYAIDRGGDRETLLEALIRGTDTSSRFVIRMRGDRHVGVGSATMSMNDAANKIREWEKFMWQRERGVEQSRVELEVGRVAVVLANHTNPVWLVAVRGLNEKGILLLTNVGDTDLQKRMGRILEIYLTRWKCEETFRCIKQSYQLEDVRVRGYISLRNIALLVQTAFFFTSVVLGRKVKLNLLLKRVFEKSRRFFEIPSFKQYAIADGLHRLLFPMKFQTGKPRAAPIPTGQLILPLPASA